MKSWDSEFGYSMSSASSCGGTLNARAYRWLGRPVLCKHGVASLRTSNTPLNPYRRFYCCSFRGSNDDCGLWEWVDPELNEHYKGCIKKLKLQLNMAEEQVAQATTVGTFNRDRLVVRQDEIQSAIVELQLAKAKNEELEAIVGAQDVKLRTCKWFLCFVAVVIAFLLKMK